MMQLKSAGFSPILLKIPGLTAPLQNAWTLEDYVNWFGAEIEKDTKINEPVIILGHSNGGRIAIAYAKANQAKVGGLILVDSAGIYDRDWKANTKRAVWGAVARLGRSLKKNKTLRNIFYKIVGEQDYRDASPLMQETMRNMISADLAPILPYIACPVAIIWGERDTATPLRDGKLMKELLPNSTLTVIKEARHSPQFTHVGEVVEAVKKYYNEKTNL